MECHLKRYISIIIVFSCAASGYAAEPVAPENNGSSAAAKEEAMDQWSKMRQQPDLTETSGTERGLGFYNRGKTISNEAVLSKAKALKNRKSAIKEEKLDGAGKAKSPSEAGKETSPDVAAKTKKLGVAGKAKVPDEAVKSKTQGVPTKAKSPDGTTKTEY
jgi:hypothetical protein